MTDLTVSAPVSAKNLCVRSSTEPPGVHCGVLNYRVDRDASAEWVECMGS